MSRCAYVIIHTYAFKLLAIFQIGQNYHNINTVKLNNSTSPFKFCQTKFLQITGLENDEMCFSQTEAESNWHCLKKIRPDEINMNQLEEPIWQYKTKCSSVVFFFCRAAVNFRLFLKIETHTKKYRVVCFRCHDIGPFGRNNQPTRWQTFSTNISANTGLRLRMLKKNKKKTSCQHYEIFSLWNYCQTCRLQRKPTNNFWYFQSY